MEETLVISTNRVHGGFLPKLLARKLKRKGIPILLTPVGWPRDELLVHKDGKIEYIQNGTIQDKLSPHFGWNGGSFLRGDDFIISSKDSNPEDKQETTHEVLDIAKALYFDISDELAALGDVVVAGRTPFRRANHIDMVYNIGNTIRKIFTYDHPLLRETGEQMATLTGYSVATVPLEDAGVLGLGFVEYGDKAVVDRRARGVRRVLKEEGYKVIPTPFGLRKTNAASGSLRCMTEVIPLDLEKLVFSEQEKFPLFLGIDGRPVKTKGPRELVYFSP